MSDGLSQVSVTPMMSRSFHQTKKSLYKKIMFLCERACNIQALMFLTDGPGFKLMSPERIKMMDHHGLIFLKQCVT